MTDVDPLEVLRIFVEAHAKPHAPSGRREPIMYLRHIGGPSLEHHGFEGEPPKVDDALLEELAGLGLLDIDYGQYNWNLTPTREGRDVVEQRERVGKLEAAADTGPIAEAVATQAKANNKLGWAAVRPVLLSIRQYWEAGGFSPHGVQVPALANALPDELQPLFSATIRSLVGGGYLRPTTSLAAFDLPVEVEVTDRAHAVLDGWPGAAPTELVENLLAVIAAEEAAETDPVRKRRLRKLAETVRDVGVSTAGEVLAKVLAGAG
jgi:hypothetical protein